ncbi:MAG: zeta toxin family protein [Prevotella sp.]|nr:zeta toxin family protein [Prevotella sp.]
MQQAPHRPVLIVIAGPNGSGKTTITSKILRHEWLEDAVYVNPDQIAQDKYGDWNSIEAVMKAANYCEELREDCLRHKQSLIFETVLSSEGKVNFIRRAKKAGYFIRVFFVSTSHPSINSARIAKRVMQGGHDVPIPKIISRYQKSILNCKRVATLADRMYVYDNSIDDAEACILFRMTDGQLVKRYTDIIPIWAQTLLD